MKPNFTLTPSTVHEFMGRINKLLNKTSMLEMTCKITGQQKIFSNVVDKFNLKEQAMWWYPSSYKHYLEKERMQFDTYPAGSQFIDKGVEGVIVRINQDSIITLLWGQKVRFSTNKATLIGNPKDPLFPNLLRNVLGRRYTLKISHNLEVGKMQNDFEERMADAFYETLEDASDWENVVQWNNIIEEIENHDNE